nr:PREDICTED: pentatricopeptide repeat-containing protein At4g14820-like [Musa acuminata subsp. malaccensis]
METATLKPLAAALPPPPSLNHRILTATTVPHFKQIHAQILRSGLDISAPFLSRLLALPLASSPSSLDYALSVLLHSPSPDFRLANRALRALSRAADPRRTLVAYGRLRRAGLALDRFSFPTVLRAAARARGVAGVLLNCLICFLKPTGSYCQSGCYNEALQLFDEMKSSGVIPDRVILATILSACARTRNLTSGGAVHSYIVESNLSIDAHLQSALISMYSNCGSMDTAQRLYDDTSAKNLVASTAMVFGYAKLGKIAVARSIFDQMTDKDLVCWSAMISGYAESDQPNEALKLFNEMHLLGVKPDQITMLSVISACANMGARDQAKWVHIFVDKNGFHQILSIRNALIDMYSKCGSLVDARTIFDETAFKDVITWTSMITGFAMHGNGRSALAVFDHMISEGVKPNGVTFISLLYACSHAGLVDEGRRIFESMIQDYRLEPKHEHYGCMVDLLGRARLLQEALEFIESMPFAPNVVVWGSLLGACRIHGDVKLGELVARRLLELDPNHDGAYVLLSNIYAKASRWEDVREVRNLMKNKGVIKEAGFSWIELNGHVHEFMMGDKCHPRSSEIYGKLDEVVKELELVGYSPDTATVLVDLQEEEKREAILLHSEKLALSLGLIDSKKGSSIHIAKNLRVCDDCHTFMKLASKVFEREIVLRDRTRFHHYKDGVCSCGDFW